MDPTTIASRIREQLADCTTLPTLPGVAIELVDTLQSAEVDLRRLSDIIQRDPALTAKVLSLVNSAHFGLKHDCCSIQHAAALLGLKTVQTIALGFSLVRGLRGSDMAGFDFNRFWKRSLLSGAAARIVGNSRRLPDIERLFLAGLMQDIGMLALQKIDPTLYGELNSLAGKDHTKLSALETSRLGVDHPTVGAWLAEEWGLPEFFRLAIQASHNPASVDVEDEERDHFEAVSLSGWLAEVWLDREDSLVYLRGSAWSRLVKDMKSGDFKTIAEAMKFSLRDLSPLFETQIDDCQKATEIMLESRDQLIDVSQSGNFGAKRSEPDCDGRDSEHQAFRDSLTGCFNRAYLEEFLIDQFVADSAHGQPTSVLFCKLNNLAAVSEQYGPDLSLEYLKQVSARISEKLRSPDQAIRWEEDEFIVVLPGTYASTAHKIVDRVQKISSKPATLGSESVEIVITIGSATHDRKRSFATLQALIHAADLQIGHRQNATEIA